MSLLALSATRLKRSFQSYTNLSLQNGYTALIRAARYGHTDTVRELLSAGSNVNKGNKVSNRVTRTLHNNLFIFLQDTCLYTVYNTQRICHTHSTVHVPYSLDSMPTPDCTPIPLFCPKFLQKDDCMPTQRLIY